MKVTVIGSGYVGLVTGTGLADMVRRKVAEGRLRFTTDVKEATKHAANLEYFANSRQLL